MADKGHRRKRAQRDRRPSRLGGIAELGVPSVSRRSVLRMMAVSMSASVLPWVLKDTRWIEAAEAAGPDLVTDTLNGLAAFVVPGPDTYSLHQGVSTVEPGAIDAKITDALIEVIDISTPFAPNFSATVAVILNNIALQVNPSASGPFPSVFARLSFNQKVTVFAIMEGLDSLKVLGGFLLAAVGFLAYSEAGVFDPATRTITGQPVGWTISDYDGVAEGRDEFKGYFQNRRKVESMEDEED